MDKINIELWQNYDDEKIRNQLLDLLIISDKEFVPALSSRESTTQTNLLGSNEDKKDEGNSIKIPYSYFNNLFNQEIIIATENDKLIGFMSFKKNYVCKNIPDKFLPNVYVSTVIVNPNHRGKGITRLFYKFINKNYKDCHIFTRTWSTNVGHLKILTSLGFNQTLSIKNDRGNGIDTVYYYCDNKVKL